MMIFRRNPLIGTGLNENIHSVKPLFNKIQTRLKPQLQLFLYETKFSDYIRPVKFTGSSSTSSSIQIRYNPPTKGPKPEAYEFYTYVTSQGYKANRLVKTIHDQASTYSVSLTGLDADTEYTIIVAARLNGSQARADNLIKVKTCMAFNTIVHFKRLGSRVSHDSVNQYLFIFSKQCSYCKIDAIYT